MLIENNETEVLLILSDNKPWLQIPEIALLSQGKDKDYTKAWLSMPAWKRALIKFTRISEGLSEKQVKEAVYALCDNPYAPLAVRQRVDFSNYARIVTERYGKSDEAHTVQKEFHSLLESGTEDDRVHVYRAMNFVTDEQDPLCDCLPMPVPVIPEGVIPAPTPGKKRPGTRAPVGQPIPGAA